MGIFSVRLTVRVAFRRQNFENSLFLSLSFSLARRLSGRDSVWVDAKQRGKFLLIKISIVCEYHFTCYCYQYNFITDQTPLIKNATYCGQTRGRLAGVQRRARSVFGDDDFCDEFITNASKGWNVGGG